MYKYVKRGMEVTQNKSGVKGKIFDLYKFRNMEVIQ